MNPLRTLDLKLGALAPDQAARINASLRAASYHGGSEVSAAYPAIFEIETTNKCGMACTHCPRPTRLSRPLADMAPELLAQVIGQLRPWAQNLYACSGNQAGMLNLMHYGEPALYPHYGLAVRLGHEQGLTMVSSSTASEFNDRALDEALGQGLDELWLIFDGLDDETFCRVRGSKASFTRGMAQLRRLLDLKKERNLARPSVTAIMIRHPYNRRQWDSFAGTFAEIPGVASYLAHFSSFSGRDPAILDLQRQILDDPAEQAEAQRVAGLNSRPCFYPWHSVCVLCNGLVVPCCRDINGDEALGDLNTQSLLDIWNGPALRRLRKRFAAGDRSTPLCRACCEGSLEIGLPGEPDPEAAELCRKHLGELRPEASHA